MKTPNMLTDMKLVEREITQEGLAWQELCGEELLTNNSGISDCSRCVMPISVCSAGQVSYPELIAYLIDNNYITKAVGLDFTLRMR